MKRDLFIPFLCYWAVPVLLCCALPVLSYLYFPQTLLFDDAAFTLKYVDNLLAGHGYRFNASDPEPVFGSSSFPYTLLAAGIKPFLPASWADVYFIHMRIGSLLGYALFLFLAFCVGKQIGGWSGGMLSLFAVGHFPEYFIYADSGLETAFAGFLLAISFYVFYVGKHSRVIYVCCALFALAKHNYYSAAYILACAELWMCWQTEPRNQRGAIRDFSLFFLLPTLGFLVFCYLYFGNVLPNSLYAKIFFLPKAAGAFPYFTYFGESIYLVPVIISLLPIGFLLAAGSLRRLRIPFRFFVVLLAALVLLGQVLALSKVEIHDWYFVNPTLAMQFVGLFAFIEIFRQQRANFRSWWPYLVLGLYLFFHLVPYFARVDYEKPDIRFRNMLAGHLRQVRLLYTTLETEKREVGRYLRQAGAPEQVVLVAHGWTAYESGMKAVDLTGINSKEVLRLNLHYLKILEAFEPDFVALQEFNFAVFPYAYHLVHISKECMPYDRRFWQVWKRKPAAHYLPFKSIRQIIPRFAR
ncbi:hypothetical protein GF373_10800, partial [bacterium]|nr:hypothetical protein [bacterium]